MKNKKKLCIIGVSALCIVVAVALCITLIPKHNGDKPTESETKEASSGTIVIDEPEKDTQSDETKNINEDDKLADDGKGRLSPEVETDDISKSGSTGEKAKDTNKTVTEQPIPNDEGKTGGISIGSGEAAAYSCGEKNHHCENAEYHAYIKNLELDGCPYCGSHSCASFYVTNEWGYTEYTPTKCPDYSNMVADYIKETNHHVAYRVTPIYDGNNLVCSGVQIEAYSVEDGGEGICFNVYCYNVQPGITIDYATGNSSGPQSSTTSKPETTKPAESVTQPPAEQPGNTETVWIPKSGSKYHSRSSCSNMKNSTQVSRAEAISRGYEPCKKCY